MFRRSVAIDRGDDHLTAGQLQSSFNGLGNAGALAGTDNDAVDDDLDPVTVAALQLHVLFAELVHLTVDADAAEAVAARPLQ